MHRPEVCLPLIKKTQLTKCRRAYRFSEIEQTAVLSVIVLLYKITVLDEPQYAHETVQERRMRVLAAQSRLALRPVRTPMMFTPRDGAIILA
jgi:hypothetical protein